jgi:hypothetical protein
MPNPTTTTDRIADALRAARAAASATLRKAEQIQESTQHPSQSTLDSLAAAAGCAHHALLDLEAALLDAEAERVARAACVPRTLDGQALPSPDAVVLEERAAYGVRRLYPASARAQALAALTGKRTLDEGDIALACDLGLDVRVRRITLA